MRRAFTFCILILVGLVTSVALIVGDTLFYKPDLAQFTDVFRQPVITPLNSLLYNTSVDNLREHGLHPRFQHVLVNLPQLLGPAYFGIIFSRHNSFLLFSALSGIALLSVIPHQEARFLLPAVPLLLSSIQLPKRHLKFWIGAWVIFNCVMGVLTGIYHQGGVIPAQLHIAGMDKVSQVFWWKSYRPPTWLLNGKAASIQTTVLMGMPGEEMLAEIDNSLPSCGTLSRSSAASALTALLVAPQSAVFLDKYSDKSSNASVELQELWRHKQHINLDDLDIPEDGLGPTWRRVLGRRGLVVWSVTRRC